MGTCGIGIGIAGFAPEVNGKFLGASKTELLEEESGGCGSRVSRSAHRTSRGCLCSILMCRYNIISSVGR
jgi:hypothetical protein